MATIERRKQKDGSVSYRAKVRLQGSPPATATFPTRTEAKKWAVLTESAVRENRYFPTLQTKHSYTLDQAITKYRETMASQQRTLTDAVQSRLRYWSRRLGNYPLQSIAKEQIVQEREVLLAGGRKPSSVNHYMAILSSVFRHCVKEWSWLKVHPMRDIPILKLGSHRVRYLSDNERVRLLDACRMSSCKGLYDIVLLTLSTGGRRGDILGLTHQDIDLTLNRVHFRHTKNGMPRTVPLTGPIVDILHEKQVDNPSSPIFTIKKRTLRTYWEKAVKQAQIQNFTFHDLRHTTGSYLAQSGVPLLAIADILGHKNLAMTRRYTHLDTNHLDQVMERMTRDKLADHI
jgi:integrase